jgi:transcriptional regulator with XRE-family HTH domain
MQFSATSDGQRDIGPRIRAILERRNLTVSEISEKTAALYGASSRFVLPHNLYYELKRGTFSPSLHQVFALSRISGYRLMDWLAVFGFDLAQVLRLQVLLPAKRTLLIDASLDDPNAWVPGFADRPGTLATPAIAPLGQLLEFTAFERLGARCSAHPADFLYAKIGREDALAFPRLVPGSIVRVDRRSAASELPPAGGKSSEHLFLFEHGRGLCCCPIRRVGPEHLLPVSHQLPYAQVELRMPSEARLLGVVDLEIRPLANLEPPEVPETLARHWEPRPLAPPAATLSQLLRHGRERTGLSLREASAISRGIASMLGDERYFVAPGSLSDYEAVDQPPRHLHKILSLCALYGLRFSDFLRSVGLDPEDAGQESIADDLRARPGAGRAGRPARAQAAEAGFVEQLVARLAPVPFFLRSCLGGLSGWAHPSLHDFFWIGGDPLPLHPYLVGGVVILVNRRTKRPIHFRAKALWQQPLYLIRRRDGTYLCAGCSLEEGRLIVHAYPQTICRPEKLRNHVEAEVVGQIMAVARSGWQGRWERGEGERERG